MEALFVYPLPIAPPERQRIVQFGIKNRLPTVTNTAAYIKEGLLTGYGPIAEVWFDGANGEGPNGRRQVYDWPRIHRVVRDGERLHSDIANGKLGAGRKDPPVAVCLECSVTANRFRR